MTSTKQTKPPRFMGFPTRRHRWWTHDLGTISRGHFVRLPSDAMSSQQIAEAAWRFLKYRPIDWELNIEFMNGKLLKVKKVDFQNQTDLSSTIHHGGYRTWFALFSPGQDRFLAYLGC